MTKHAYTFRFKAAASTACIAALATASCASPSDGPSSPGDAESITIGSDLTYPPYDYLEGTTPMGFDADLWAELGPEIGVTTTFQDTRFEQLINGLKSSQFDVISSALYITAERAEQVDYIPYFSTGNSIITPTDGTEKPATIEELCGLRVSALKGSDIANQLATDGAAVCSAAGKDAIAVNDFPTDPEATQVLLAGQVDAQVTDAAVAANVIGSREGLEITSDELLYPVPVGMAVTKGNDALKERIETGLTTLKESGAYEELLAKYNLVEPSQEQLDTALGN